MPVNKRDAKTERQRVALPFFTPACLGRQKRQTKKNPTIADRVFLKVKQPGGVSPNNKPDD
ncbi:MAG: hypothetical protein WC810_01895, partial [Janthinobacterium sp.]